MLYGEIQRGPINAELAGDHRAADSESPGLPVEQVDAWLTRPWKCSPETPFVTQIAPRLGYNSMSPADLFTSTKAPPENPMWSRSPVWQNANESLATLRPAQLRISATRCRAASSSWEA